MFQRKINAIYRKAASESKGERVLYTPPPQALDVVSDPKQVTVKWA